VGYFFGEDFFFLTFFVLGAAFALVVFFFSPNALSQLSEYFLVVPLRRMVIVLSYKKTNCLK
jgi:hypothetical protein